MREEQKEYVEQYLESKRFGLKRSCTFCPPLMLAVAGFWPEPVLDPWWWWCPTSRAMF